MRSKHLRVLVLLLHAALILGLPVWIGIFNAWMTLPLFFPISGMIRGQPYTYAWASMLQLFYAGALMLGALEGSKLATALAVIAVVEFCAQLLFVRVRAAELRNEAAATVPSPAAKE